MSEPQLQIRYGEGAQSDSLTLTEELQKRGLIVGRSSTPYERVALSGGCNISNSWIDILTVAADFSGVVGAVIAVLSYIGQRKQREGDRTIIRVDVGGQGNHVTLFVHEDRIDRHNYDPKYAVAPVSEVILIPPDPEPQKRG